MKTTTLAEKATDTVNKMIELGALFTISVDGTRWSWSPHPEPMRGAIRRFWQAVPDRCAPGFPEAMLLAIRHLNNEGGRANVR